MNYGGYGRGMNYNPGNGWRMYGSYNGHGGTNGRGMYDNTMYTGVYDYPYWRMYGREIGHPHKVQDPNSANSNPNQPGSWFSYLQMVLDFLKFLGQISRLMRQSTHAFQILLSSTLQLFYSSKLLYGDIARFVLELLGIRINERNVLPGGGANNPPHQGPHHAHMARNNANPPHQGPHHAHMAQNNANPPHQGPHYAHMAQNNANPLHRGPRHAHMAQNNANRPNQGPHHAHMTHHAHMPQNNAIRVGKW